MTDDAHEFRIVRRGDRDHRIAVIDGPNMSNLGARSRKVYGDVGSLDDLKAYVAGFGERLGVTVENFSSNYEGAILEYIHESAERVDAYIVNPAGLTTVGEGVRHALEETGRPVVEVHFSNIQAGAGHGRGLGGGPIASSFTHTATGLTMGMRQYSYIGALTALVAALDDGYFLGEGVAGD
ncbi:MULTISPECIES: type II 3-dehydroquinate dehydratase [Actinoalloteichus]|uniref:3-dehydroquinate dehydratase n=1 Tax=Actinoalloteichus fjordicus TaxID=1612552 RepID=A0AAC9PTW4_9PSEU|nr:MULTISPECIES: type II 3-dehydroquinate dehydratase [Actinoalloteichus]APU16477.1 3-dehydroquinate dehydratase [Actinoalloteichus fjordicus]APU22536.1 3-dehydroquinate dehydratase [Actinoalloteichus sp. GBA129-24]